MSHGWCLVTQVNAYRWVGPTIVHVILVARHLQPHRKALWQVMEALGGIAKDEATGMQRVEVTKMVDPWVETVNSWYQVDKV